MIIVPAMNMVFIIIIKKLYIGYNWKIKRLGSWTLIPCLEDYCLTIKPFWINVKCQLFGNNMLQGRHFLVSDKFIIRMSCVCVSMWMWLLHIFHEREKREKAYLYIPHFKNDILHIHYSCDQYHYHHCYYHFH